MVRVRMLHKLCGLVALAMLVSAATGIGQSYPSSLYQGMRWRLVGPFRGGRAEAAVGIPGDPSTYYFGAVAGGVWKSSDAGVSWAPIFDGQANSSIGALAVAPSDPKVIYVGTGERDLRNDITYGEGVYKSVNGGKTWVNLGLKDTRHIATIVIDPQDANNVYLAAVGHAFGPNEERGVFHTMDGGKTWKKILYVNDRTGATDLAVDPNNRQILFASMYEARRTAYSMISGGPGSGLYKSIDGGAAWRRLEGHGLPDGILGRIGVTISGANSKRIYAIIEAKENTIYSSSDGGETWAMVNNEPLWVRPWYQNEIFADPKDENTLYSLNVGTFRSTDGGHTFQQLAGVPHTDDHQLWIDPLNPRRMIEANDGGATISLDGGTTWSLENNQPTAQFYHVATSNDFNYIVYGSQQDSGSVAIRSRTDHGSIGEGDWNAVGGGESGFLWPDPRDSEIVFGGDHNGCFTRYDEHTGQVANISPWFGARAHPASDLKHRFQWTAPMQISPHDPNVMYVGGEAVFKTANGGMSWTVISPDLTRNDKSKQQSTPEPLTPDNSSSEYYDTVFAIAESPVQKDLIWAGSDDGLVHLTSDGGKHWANVTPRELPPWSRVDLIEPSRYAAGTAYMAADLHFSDDFRPMLYKTTDFGKNWRSITDGIPADRFVHSVHEDPKRRGLLYAGTEKGIYISFDDGAQWQSLQLNLPLSPIYDTAVHGDDLIVATHGRSFWVLHNISPIRQANPSILSQPAHLYAPVVAYRELGGRGQGNGLVRNFVPNPPAGAAIDYYLSPSLAGPVSLVIADAAGQVVYRGQGGDEQQRPEKAGRGGVEAEDRVPARPGLNRFLWNMRLAGPVEVPGMVIAETAGGGPVVPPGKYEVTLTAAGKSYTERLTLSADPRLTVSPADFAEQYKFAVKLRDRVTEVHETVNAMRAARVTMEAKKKADPAKVRQIDAIEKTMSGLEEQLIQVASVTRWAGLVYPIELDAQYAELMQVVESADSAPPAQTYEVFAVYERERQEVISRWDALQKEIAALGA